MDTLEKQRFIRAVAAKVADEPTGAAILWSRHAIAKAVREQLTRQMIGALENSICLFCGGRLEPGLANIPFILEGAIVIIKNAPALICTDCYEPFLDGPVTDQVMSLLTQ